MKQHTVLVSVCIVICLLAAGCGGQKTNQTDTRPFLEKIVSVKNETLAPADIAFGMSPEEVIKKTGLKESDYDQNKERIVTEIKDSLLSEPAVWVINFANGKAASVEVTVVHQKDLPAFLAELQKQTEKLLPKEWLQTAGNAVAEGSVQTQWVDPSGILLSIGTADAGSDGTVVTIHVRK